MKKVFSSADRIMTQYLKQVLDTQGIECLIRNEFLSGAAGELPVMETWPELWVLDDSRQAQARQVIDEVVAAPLNTASWVCPQCNELIEGQFDLCWHCGSPRADAAQ